MQSTLQSSKNLFVVVWSRSFKKEVQSLARYSSGAVPQEHSRHHDAAYWPVTARHRESESESTRAERPNTPSFLHEEHHKLHYEIAEPADSSSIVNFIAKHFVPDAALEMALGAPAKEMEDYYENVVERALRDKASLLGFRGDHLCAIHLSTVRDFSDASRGEKPPKAMHPKDYVKEISEGKYGHRSANKINAFLRALEEDMPNVFPECRRMFYMEVASVANDLRQKGVCLEMTQLAMELGRQQKCDHAATIAVSKPVQKLMVQKLGFEVERELQYAAFLDNGHPAFPLDVKYENPGAGFSVSGQLVGKRL